MTKSILVVDYDPKRIETTTKPFAEAGFRVEVARDGVAGVEAFARLHPDLVLVEMMLPKRHGFEVCQELRKLRPSKRTPVLILGTSQAERYRMQAIGAGANDYLVRPIADERLIEICRGLLSEPNQDLPETPAAVARPAPVEAAGPAPVRAVQPPPAAAAAAPVDLATLSDEEIAARLDAILPTAPGPGPGPTLEKAKAPTPEPRRPEAVQPPAKPEVTKPRAAAPVASRDPQATIPLAVTPDRPAPKARLPQAAPVPQVPAVAAGTMRRGMAWPVVAVVALVAVVGGSYAWRAVTTNDGASVEAPTLDATDFAKVPATVETTPTETAEPVAPPAAPPVEPEPSVVAKPRVEIDPVYPPPATRSATVEAERPAPPLVPPPAPSAVRPAEKPLRSPSPQSRVSTPPAAPIDGSVVGVDRIPAPVEDPAGPAIAAAITPIEGATRVPEKEQAEEPPAGIVPGSIVDLASVDSPPVAVSRTAPAYPPMARRMRREGKVAVRLLVDENGNVADAVVSDASSPSDFAASALKAARTWRYRPARKDGVAVKVWVTEVIGFKM